MLSKNEKQFKTGTLENNNNNNNNESMNSKSRVKCLCCHRSNNNNKPTKLVTQTRARDQPTRRKPEQTLQTTG